MNIYLASSSPRRKDLMDSLSRRMGFEYEIWPNDYDEAEPKPDIDFPSGEYFCKRKVAQANPQAYDDELGRQLWVITDHMIDKLVVLKA